MQKKVFEKQNFWWVDGWVGAEAVLRDCYFQSKNLKSHL